MLRYHAPCDPECPEYSEYVECLFNDPMTQAMGAPVDDIMEDYERKHCMKCKRCQEYGAANIDIMEG
jgi:hypothetical protein